MFDPKDDNDYLSHVFDSDLEFLWYLSEYFHSIFFSLN